MYEKFQKGINSIFNYNLVTLKLNLFQSCCVCHNYNVCMGIYIISNVLKHSNELVLYSSGRNAISQCYLLDNSQNKLLYIILSSV